MKVEFSESRYNEGFIAPRCLPLFFNALKLKYLLTQYLKTSLMILDICIHLNNKFTMLHKSISITERSEFST